MKTNVRAEVVARQGRRTFFLAIVVMFYAALVLTGVVSPTAAKPVPPGSDVKIATVSPNVVKLNIQDKLDVVFRRLSLAEGLSQTRVSQIVQDDEGYLWFGTQHGVNRYDGYGFHLFKHVLGDEASLSGTYVYALFKDRSGTIWVGSDQYLDAFDRRTGAFRHYKIDATNPTVIHISQDAGGQLWLSTSQGLYRLDPLTGLTTRFAHDPDDQASLSSNDVKSTGEDREGTFWVATSAGLESFDRATGRVAIRIPLRQEVREFSFHEDSHGTFWLVYGSGNGLAIYDRKTNTLVKYSFEDDAAESGLSGVYSILETSDGDIWLATMGSGLLRFDRDKFQFSRYRNDPSDPQSLAENRAIALFEDSEGNIWAGLHASPPNMFPKEPPPFRRLWPFPGHFNKLGETLVNTIFKDRQGTVWVGAGGALNRIGQDGTLRVLTPTGPNTSVEVLSISQDKTGTLWIGTLGAGLFALDPQSETFKSYRYSAGRADGISSDIVTRIHVDDAGYLWLATWNGLDRFDPVRGNFTTYKRDPSSSAETYSSITADRDGILWLGTTNGLVRFDSTGSTFKVYAHEPSDPASLSNNTVNSVIAGADNILWIATQNGLNRFEKDSARFTSFFDTDGLAGNAVSCLLGDGDGNIWMSTNRGISKMDIDTIRFENYSTTDGLPGDDLTGWNACTSGADGDMYFGGFGGAAVKKRNDVGHDVFVPPVVFTEMQIADQPKTALASSVADNVTTFAPIMLPYSASRLTVSFAALSFRSPASTRYRYRLSGLDTKWHVANSDQRTISYATLPVGSFMLQVQAATKRGIWNQPGASLQIEVRPPWWRNWWTYAGSAIAVVCLLAAMYRYRVMKVAEQFNIRLEAQMTERNRLARDLHDTLLQSFQGLTFRLQAARHLLPGKPGEAAAMLDVVLEKSDAAIVEGRDAVQALRDSTRTDSDIVAAIRQVGDELVAMSSDVPAPRFTLNVIGRARPLEAKTQQEVYRIVCEALRNAFKHSGANAIECNLHFFAKELRVQVGDNGSGIAFYPEKGRSEPGHWGMAGMKERAERIGAHLMIESLSGKGTTINLILKIQPMFAIPYWGYLAT